MVRDPLVDEIHIFREEISKESGDNMERIAAAARQRQERSGSESVVVRLEPKCVTPVKKVS